MNELFARILANHAADVIKKITGLHPTVILVEGRPKALPLYELNVCIDFQGSLSDNKHLRGYATCGSQRHDDSLPLLTAMATHLGFDRTLAETPDGRTNLLSEFLNIIMGLTGAGWAEHGFKIDFSTPLNLSGESPVPPENLDEAFHILINTDASAKVNILVVFNH